jgi:hypothetical protein
MCQSGLCKHSHAIHLREGRWSPHCSQCQDCLSARIVHAVCSSMAPSVIVFEWIHGSFFVSAPLVLCLSFYQEDILCTPHFASLYTVSMMTYSAKLIKSWNMLICYERCGSSSETKLSHNTGILTFLLPSSYSVSHIYESIPDMQLKLWIELFETFVLIHVLPINTSCCCKGHMRRHCWCHLTTIHPVGWHECPPSPIKHVCKWPRQLTALCPLATWHWTWPVHHWTIDLQLPLHPTTHVLLNWNWSHT